MPYIKQEDRASLRNIETATVMTPPDNAGELNYIFTQIALIYLDHKGLKYQHINDIVGALEGAKLEMYRRLAAPYEDAAILRNGDVEGYKHHNEVT